MAEGKADVTGDTCGDFDRLIKASYALADIGGGTKPPKSLSTS